MYTRVDGSNGVCGVIMVVLGFIVPVLVVVNVNRSMLVVCYAVKSVGLFNSRVIADVYAPHCVE